MTARGPASGPGARRRTAPTPRQIPLAEVAKVEVVEGPATIKSENGLLRNYVRMNVSGRDAAELVAEARQVVAREAKLPAGVFVEWTGQFEHTVHARRTLIVVVPIVVALIFLILYWTYHDLADAILMMLAVPGAIAGGLFFQWLLGLKLSVTVWVGYIACFGMATSTGIIMLVYLREAIARAGGLERMNLRELRAAVLERRGPSPAPQTADRGNGRSRVGPDALGQRCRLGDHPPDGGPGPGRHPGGRRGDRPVSAGALLLGAPPAVEATACGRGDRRVEWMHEPRTRSVKRLNLQTHARHLRGGQAGCRSARYRNVAKSGSFSSVTRTGGELSIVCPEANVPLDVTSERGFGAFAWRDRSNSRWSGSWLRCSIRSRRRALPCSSSRRSIRTICWSRQATLSSARGLSKPRASSDP